MLHAISLHAGVSNSGTDSEEDSDRARSRSPSSTTNSAEFGSGPSVDTHSLDIGLLLRKGDLQKLPRNHKLEIINHVPDPQFNYPATYMNGCNRRFKVEWVKAHPWLHYSSTEDGAYCKACALFAPEDAGSQKLGILVVKPFCKWTKQSSVFQSHEQCQYHHDSMTKMLGFKETCTDPAKGVASMLNQECAERMRRNTTVMKSLLECIIFCGKQGLPLRGHRDDSTCSDAHNKGNFLELVQFRAVSDEPLRQHLEAAPRNAVYTSKTIQN